LTVEMRPESCKQCCGFGPAGPEASAQNERFH
jgi:hypothetical protein